MSFLIVVLTITLASVANIHLSMSEALRQNVPDNDMRAKVEMQVGQPFRAEINSSAWLLFWAFVVCAVALLVKGHWNDSVYVKSAVHGVAIIVVTINLFVLRDLYKTTYIMAGGPLPPIKTAKDAKDADQP